MKIRQGFVSNSSSTSFCIYGVTFAPDSGISYEDVENFNRCFQLEFGYYDLFNIYVGVPLSKMQDFESFGGFKKRIQEWMDVFCDEHKINHIICDVHERAWHD